jgi:hypothetical protein
VDDHTRHREPESLRRDHRERRLVALAVRVRARAQDRAAVLGDLDLTELRLADRVRDLDVRAEPDPELHPGALGAPTPLLLPELVVPGRAEQEVERPLVVAGVIGRPGRRQVGESVLGDEVHPADLGRVESRLGREEIDRPVDRLRRLGSAGATDRGRRRRVGHDRHRSRLDFRDRIDAVRHQCGQVGEVGAEGRVRAAVAEHLEPIGEELPGSRSAERVRESLTAPVREPEHVLRAGLGPPDRTTERAREPRDEHGLGLDHLRAESSADVRADDAHLGRVEPEQPGDDHLPRVRRL